MLESQNTAVATREDQAERRHLTVMFCDLVGSVALSTTLDPEEFREMLSRYLETASTVVRRFSGFVGQYHGDGMLVYFGYPRAREDSAILGVRCGIGILRAIEGLNRESSTQLRVRIGLHTGLLVVGELGTGDRRESSVVVGKVPNLAARLQSLAQPGTVVISGDTWKLVRAHFRCESLGEHPVKGLAEPLAVYQVLGDADLTGMRNGPQDLTRLFGRDAELERLRERWAEAAGGGAPRVALVGEAGIGKSRLLREFIRALAGQAHYCLTARGSAEAQNSAFEPLLQLLRERMEIRPTDTPAAQLEKIAGFVEAGPFPPETTGLLATILGGDESQPAATPPISPAAARQRFIAWLPDFLRTLAERRPVVFVLEDLHWIDPSTLEALAFLFAAPPLPRVLLLVTARPEFTASWLPPETIALARLSAGQVAEFAEAVSGGKALPAEVVRQIVAKANGVPLFIEEMTKMVLDTGLLVECDAHFETRAPLPPMAIPDTLHELLMARLEGPATAREVAQIASVLGQEFEYSMLRALSPAEDHVLREQLDRLVEAGLLAQEGTIPQARFAFRHALIQAEAYQSLLKRKRQFYHERIAGMLAGQFPDTLRQKPELVAHHYTEAGRHAEAIDLWLQAATRSESRSANAEAIAQADEGLALLAALTDSALRRERELSLTVVRGRAAVMLRGYGAEAVKQAFFRAGELCSGSDSRPEFVQALGALHGYYIARAEFALAGGAAEQMLRLAEATGRSDLFERAWLSQGVGAFYLGQFDESLAAFQRVLAGDGHTLQPLPSRTLDPRVAALGWGGIVHILCGRVDEGLAFSDEACAVAAARGHTHSQAYARHFRQLTQYWLDDAADIVSEGDEFLAFCREQDFTYWLTLGAMVQGWAYVRLGRVPGMESLAKGLAGWQRTGARLAATQHYGFLAAASARLGAISGGLSAIAQAEEVAGVTGELCYAPHMAELKGALLLRQSPPDLEGAEAAFRSAIDLARGRAASWLELRAATQLASLLRDQGRHDAARAALEPCLRAIAGGDGKALVCEARGLLASLPARSELHAD